MFSECCILSFGWFPASEFYVPTFRFHLHRWCKQEESAYTTHKYGTECFETSAQNSNAGESPKRKNTTNSLAIFHKYQLVFRNYLGGSNCWCTLMNENARHICVPNYQSLSSFIYAGKLYCLSIKWILFLLWVEMRVSILRGGWLPPGVTPMPPTCD